MDIRLPRLGEGADTGTVVSIFVKPGDKIKKSATILELENEKAVAPIPSPSAGTVTTVHVKEGDKIQVGQLLISVTEEGAAPAQGQTPAPPAAASNQARSPQPAAAPQPQETEGARAAQPPPSTQSTPSTQQYQYQSPSGAEPPASPSVRKIASELGIDLRRVRGSERGGRIVMEDIKAYIRGLEEAAQQPRAAASAAEAPKPATAPSIDFSKWGKVTKKPATSLRRVIAQRMTESWTTIPHVTQFDDADITKLLALRKKHAPAYEKKGAALTLTAFAIQAVVKALKKFPQFNSSLDEATGELVLKEYFHIGIAVDTEQGLIVPVLRDADKKSLIKLAKEIGELAEKTRSRKIASDDLKGGSFTISNLGSLGGAHFTPIVNKPEVAILGLGKGASKPVVVDGQVVVRTIMPVCLSYDHRVIDGADGARFVRELVTAFESFVEADVKI